MSSNPNTFFHPGTKDGEALQLSLQLPGYNGWEYGVRDAMSTMPKECDEFNQASDENNRIYNAWCKGEPCAQYRILVASMPHLTLLGSNAFLEPTVEFGLGVLCTRTAI